MKARFFPALLCLLLAGSAAWAQKPQGVIPGDDTSKHQWNENMKEVEIPSSADGAMQKAYFHATASATPQPLIVSFHTWSGDYSQRDPLEKEMLLRDYNYIHPDYRGSNTTPQGCGSPLAISDIEDAIAWAIAHGNVDKNEVHLVGSSGGGYATLLAYMTVKYPVKSFSAWVAISDLEAWYWESLGRKNQYAGHIFAATSSVDELDVAEARRRSPFWMPSPGKLREGSRLYIYTGANDGYTGSVPITHSILMYNRLLTDRSAAPGELVDDRTIISLLAKRGAPNADPRYTIGSRQVWLHREYQDLSLTVFDGGHEQLSRWNMALTPLYGERDERALKILTLGDSNAAHADGWSDQISMLLPFSQVVNIARSGRSISFNVNEVANNALAYSDTLINQAAAKMPATGYYDRIVVCLGTNDALDIFADRQKEVAPSFGKLLDKLMASKIYTPGKTRLVVVSPPPLVQERAAKYRTGEARLKALIPQLKAEAVRRGCTFVDVYNPLLKTFPDYAPDGVHMNPTGQRILARMILEQL